MPLNKTQLAASEVKIKDMLLSANIYSSEKIQTFIDGVYAVKYEAGQNGSIQSSKALNPLSVIVASEDDFSNIKSTESIDSDALYLVEADNLNAYGKRVKNVGYPVEKDDAATLKYVSDVGKNIAFEEFNSIGNAEVDEVYNLKTSDHVPTTYINDVEDRVGDCDLEGISSFDLVLSKIFKKTSKFSVVKIKEISILGPYSLQNEIDNTEYKLKIMSKSKVAESSNSVRLEKSLQVLKFTFNEIDIDPSDKITIAVTSDSDSSLKSSFRMQTVSGLTSTNSDGSIVGNKIPYILSMSIVPVKAVDGILMKGNNGDIYCAKIVNGSFSIIRIRQ